jgi:cytochrome c553
MAALAASSAATTTPRFVVAAPVAATATSASAAVAAAVATTVATSAAAKPTTSATPKCATCEEPRSPIRTRAKKRRLASQLEGSEAIPQLDGYDSSPPTTPTTPTTPAVPATSTSPASPPSSPPLRQHLLTITYSPAGSPLRSSPPQLGRREEIEGRGSSRNGKSYAAVASTPPLQQQAWQIHTRPWNGTCARCGTPTSIYETNRGCFCDPCFRYFYWYVRNTLNSTDFYLIEDD